MTEQVTTPENGDVLSSIRRLVADDPSRYPAPRVGRLVLKPSQRVSSSEEKEAPLDLGEIAILVDADLDEPVEDPGKVETFFATGQGADGFFRSSVAERSDVAAQNDRGALLGEAFDEAANGLIPEEDAPDTEFAAQPRNYLMPERKHDKHSAVEVLKGVVSADDGFSWQAEGAFEEAASGLSPRRETLESKIAALEAVIGRSEEEFEPDGSRVVDTGPAEALPWEDHLAQAVSSELEEMFGAEEPDENHTVPFFSHAQQHSGHQPDGGDQHQSAALPEEGDAEVVGSIMDEEALRALVGDIVRQELQGQLGERITRNVRKLVRREVNRALSEKNII